MSKNGKSSKPAGAAPTQDAKRFQKSADDYIRRHASTKEGALSFLVAAGTHTRKGNLKKPYK